MKNKAGFILFGALAVAIAGVTIWNIYLNQNISQATASKQLQVTNNTLKQENNELKQQLNEVLPSAQEQQKRAYLDTVKQFIDVSYHREKEGFEERKRLLRPLWTKNFMRNFIQQKHLIMTIRIAPIPVTFIFMFNSLMGGKMR